MVLTINVVMPVFVEAHFLDVSPLSYLVDGKMGINGFGGLFSLSWGYVINKGSGRRGMRLQ